MHIAPDPSDVSAPMSGDENLVDSACSDPLALTARPANSAARGSMNLIICVSPCCGTFHATDVRVNGRLLSLLR